MAQAPYRLSYTHGSDGKHRLAVEVFGPLPDPLAGLDAEQRRGVQKEKRTLAEHIMLVQTLRYPAMARQAVNYHVMASRRLRWEAKSMPEPSQDVEPEQQL